MIYDPNKNKLVYFSYDLIVFDEFLKEINLILEYNGPWHYSKDEVKKDPNSPSHPYKKNITSKKQVYEKDLFKLNYIKRKCSNILIYWEKDKKLQKYEECY